MNSSRSLSRGGNQRPAQSKTGIPLSLGGVAWKDANQTGEKNKYPHTKYPEVLRRDQHEYKPIDAVASHTLTVWWRWEQHAWSRMNEPAG